jgi:hypothetical protein
MARRACHGPDFRAVGVGFGAARAAPSPYGLSSASRSAAITDQSDTQPPKEDQP